MQSLIFLQFIRNTCTNMASALICHLMCLLQLYYYLSSLLLRMAILYKKKTRFEYFNLSLHFILSSLEFPKCAVILTTQHQHYASSVQTVL